MRFTDRLALGLRKKLPVMLQSEAAECGLACLAMIASYHGSWVDVGTLRRRFSISAKGTTLTALIDFARRLELSSRPVRLELDDLVRLKLPCILHWNFTHFVVLARVDRRRITIHDPGAGERTLQMAAATAAFTGVALELWPTPRFERSAPAPAVRLRDLLGRVSGARSALAQVLALGAGLEVFVIVNPLFLQWVFDHAVVTGSRDLLDLLAVGFGVLAICEQCISALRSWVVMYFETTLNIQWRANVFAHLVDLPLAFFERRHLGDVISRFRSIDAIQRTLTTAFIESVVDGCMTVALLAVMYRYSPMLTWICAGATGLYALSRSLAYSSLRAAGEEQIAHTARQESHLLETVRGLRSIKLFQRHDERRCAWLTLLVEQINAGVRAQKVQIALRLTNGVLFGVENVLAVFLGARAVLDAEFSVGMLIAYISYKRQFASRLSALIDKAFELKLLRLHAERLADIVLTEPESGNDAPGRLLSGSGACLDATIELRSLRFRYAEHEPFVLDGVDLKVAEGESVAIVGASGCGKSTLVHVLLGILPATSGDVLIGGTHLASMDRGALRRTVASVTQGDCLFAGSIADNISFFDAHADQARVEECARIASIHAEIAGLPMGYNTMVGYFGATLSAGQQQRILLARALYARPAILVLDEATSHLDVKREILVSSAIRALNVTRVIVAHRPQTAATADRIVTLNEGRIVQDTRLVPSSTTPRRTRLEAVPRTVPTTTNQAWNTSEEPA
ncbi:MAG TPA: peptidase domain-containing ABC transporter [Gammaproteobacteria bacterium]|nr:peptidase domain-containing ABC transporter [Gammaproteobacteria bacterium]